MQRGYRNGDIAWWLPGNDFVIFTEREENSGEVEGCVILGRLLSGVEEIRDMGRSITVPVTEKVNPHRWETLNETAAFR